MIMGVEEEVFVQRREINAYYEHIIEHSHFSSLFHALASVKRKLEDIQRKFLCTRRMRQRSIMGDRHISGKKKRRAWY